MTGATATVWGYKNKKKKGKKERRNAFFFSQILEEEEEGTDGLGQRLSAMIEESVTPAKAGVHWVSVPGWGPALDSRFPPLPRGQARE